MGNARARKIPAQLVEEEYQLRHERVAGTGIAKAKADVCTRLPPVREGGRRASRLEEVPAEAREILALAERLLADGVELVAMESTSDYWRIWYYLLEAAGLNVQLVNPAHARQLAGRPKTDRLDAQQIARLAEMGLLRPSFVPPPEIRALRDLTRARLQMVRDRTREWQRLEKLLEGALIKLSSVVWSLARTKTARDILEAIAGGERDPKTLAALAAAHVKAAAPPSSAPWTACGWAATTPCSSAPTSTTPPCWTGRSRRSRTRSRPPWTPSPPPGESPPTASRPPTPARTRRPCPLPSGSRRSPASAASSPWPSSPRRAWT
jgi:Transposase